MLTPFPKHVITRRPLLVWSAVLFLSLYGGLIGISNPWNDPVFATALALIAIAVSLVVLVTCGTIHQLIVDKSKNTLTLKSRGLLYRNERVIPIRHIQNVTIQSLVDNAEERSHPNVHRIYLRLDDGEQVIVPDISEGNLAAKREMADRLKAYLGVTPSQRHALVQVMELPRY